MDDLLAWAGGKPSARSECRPVTVEEAVALGEADLVGIGAHTVTHSLLSALSPSEQSFEIRRGKEALARISVLALARPQYTSAPARMPRLFALNPAHPLRR